MVLRDATRNMLSKQLEDNSGVIIEIFLDEVCTEIMKIILKKNNRRNSHSTYILKVCCADIGRFASCLAYCFARCRTRIEKTEQF